ncbi:hypothetical protein IW140_004984 [Coemansia sp. RSA 1813]|nr:hypothetical protein EV178_005583 [Coemansia sp. RSA 1646]KAJ1768558.1 hypothetical protein LPJ74_004796 [Coemansia sp. RSA 1843]KAJ2085481.1 hypothetical protein IW138_006303 [Coemansia sp. RSA 986]KAJ2213001.1 hypothetical protein EV179_004229 [Coemansia sp. RSA 487]KAJ2566296.1 hypothetical protein IW140_004984 [Coemansia sp. RSA 1813]
MHIADIFNKRPKYTIDDKVVLVTGALTTVGRKLVYQLVHLGARVVLVDGESNGTGEQLSQAINDQTKHETSVYVRAQLDKVHDIRLMIDAAVLTFGRLDVLVNNAERYVGGISTEEEEDADRICGTIDVNFRAPVVATWVFARYLRQSGNIGGVAVNVAAMAGLLPGRGREVYGAANAGLIHFTEASKAMAPRLRVCALAPYYVDGAVVHGATTNGNQERLLPGQKLGAPLLALSSDQVVASVIRCIEDTRMAGKTLLIAGESSYVNSWSYVLSWFHMLCIMVWSTLSLLVQRAFGRIPHNTTQQLPADSSEEAPDFNEHVKKSD